MSDIRVLKAELKAIGQYWRNNWDSFDGRILKSQINQVIKNFETGTNLYYFRKKLEEQEKGLHDI